MTAAALSPLIENGGKDTNEIFKKDFFALGPANTKEEFTVTLSAVNGNGIEGTCQLSIILAEASIKNVSKGLTKMHLHVNHPPVNGSCAVVPNFGTFLVDKFTLKCKDWVDPEDKGIRKFRAYSNTKPFISSALLLPYPKAGFSF